MSGSLPPEVVAIPAPELTPSEQDMDIAARTVWGEARGEGEAGMRAVAAAIVNRARAAAAWKTTHKKDRHPLFGDGTLASACTAKAQFSCWNQGDPNRARMEALPKADPLYLKAREAVAWALANPDPTLGATHYHSSAIAPPGWTKAATFTVKIGSHLFYKNVR